MEENNENFPIADLLRCSMQLIGRIAIPEDSVRAVLATSKRHIRAFNLADGSRTITEIAKLTHIDQGNLSKAASRWIKNGVAFWVGSGKSQRLLHIYPVSESITKKKT